MNLKGRAWKFGDNINTDIITPGPYLELSIKEQAKHVMEPLRPDFAKEIREGDFIVAGTNFGSGSSRETAPLALKAAGISAVLAVSAARIFFRNAINVGLPILVGVDINLIEEGDELMVSVLEGSIVNLTKQTEIKAQPLEPSLVSIVVSGGLIPYLERDLGRQSCGLTP